MVIRLSNPCPNGWQSRGWVNGKHRGIDYGWYNADPAKSRQVFAAAPGKVVSVYGKGDYNQGWGNRVEIRHTDRTVTTYNHLATGTIKVKVGQVVAAGTYIGQMGNTGITTGISLHFELYIDGNRVDPAPYFTKDLPGTPVIAVAPPVLGAKDRLTVAIGVNARTEPTSLSAKVKGVPGNTVIAMQGFRDDGQDVQGNRRWFLSTEGHWYWSGGFTNASPAGLEDRTPAPLPPAPEPVPEPEVPAEPEPTPEPEPPAEPEPVPVPEPVEPDPEEPDPTPVDPLPPFPEPTTPQPGEPDPPLQHAKPRPLYGWIGGIIAVIVGTIIALFGR